jgi:hypothetical protein
VANFARFTVKGAQRIRSVVEAAEREFVNAPAGRRRWPIISAGGSETVRIQVPAGGITAGNYADCRYYRADHNLSPAGTVLRVWNRGDVTVGAAAAKIGYAAWVARESEYQVVQRFC